MASEIVTITVIGAGDLGREIAALALFAGYRTILEDVSESRLEGAAAALLRLGGEARVQLVTANTVEDAVRDADLILEAVAEEMEMKIELFTIFDKFAKPGAIFASSSPSLSIADMASATFCGERCIGMRFPAAAGGKNILELVCAPETSEETVAACREVARRMGKEIIVVQEMEPSKQAAVTSDPRRQDAGATVARQDDSVTVATDPCRQDAGATVAIDPLAFRTILRD
jgi:3-hydroxyacyl-CoA dehydrogenase